MQSTLFLSSHHAKNLELFSCRISTQDTVFSIFVPANVVNGSLIVKVLSLAITIKVNANLASALVLLLTYFALFSAIM